MNCNFIELTEKDGSKILINALYIASIEPNKSGSTITFSMENYSFPKKVQESYETIKSLIKL
jgi:hypothetical protein